MKRVVVLGAGVTGLAAADRLIELGGCEVTVVEADAAVGGLAATVRRDGVATDLGPHRLHTEIAEVRSLLPEILGDRLVRVRRSSRMLLAGRWISYPLKRREVFQALGAGKVLQIATDLAVARLGGLAVGKRAVTFEDEMKRAFGATAYRVVLEPFARKVWRTEPARLSAAVARVRLPARGIAAAFGSILPCGKKKMRGPVREFHYVRGGIGRLCEVLSERIERAGGRILTNSRAVDLRFDARGVCGAAVEQPDGNVWIDCDALISTIPLPEFGRMVPGGDAEIRAALAGLEYLSMILVVLIVGKDRVGPDHWLYFPHEPPVVTRACEPKNFDKSMSPAGKTCLCCEITCRRDEPFWKSNDAEIADRVRSEIVETELLRADEICDHYVIRKNWAYPIYTVGFEKKLESIWSFLARIPNMITTGRQGLFNHNNIDHCLVMGRRAAELVSAGTEPARAWYSNLGQFAGFRIFD